MLPLSSFASYSVVLEVCRGRSEDSGNLGLMLPAWRLRPTKPDLSEDSSSTNHHHLLSHRLKSTCTYTIPSGQNLPNFTSSPSNSLIKFYLLASNTPRENAKISSLLRTLFRRNYATCERGQPAIVWDHMKQNSPIRSASKSSPNFGNCGLRLLGSTLTHGSCRCSGEPLLAFTYRAGAPSDGSQAKLFPADLQAITSSTSKTRWFSVRSQIFSAET